MQSRTKAHVLRGMGGLVAALAVVPWLGAGAAQASSQNDGSCTTVPSGVASGASCTLLTGPNGTTVFGETWVVRTAGNQFNVKTFPQNPPDGTTGVSLCLSTSPYAAKHQCNAGDPDNVYTGSGTVINVALASFGIKAGDPVYYSLSVLQASTTAVSNGNGGKVPSKSPSPTATSTSPSASASHTKTPTATPSHSHTHSPSPSVSATHTSESPSPSVSATHTSRSPSPSVSATHTSQSPSTSVSASRTHKTDKPSPLTSVLAVKLARTGADGTQSALVLSVGLLALGGILMAAGQSNRPKRRH